MTTGTSIDRTTDPVEIWARSGAMALAGRSDGLPLGPPQGLVEKMGTAAEGLGARSAALGRRVDIDPLQLLGERAAIAGLGRRGQISCGGGTRLLPAGDGWVAVSLPRPDDVDLVPAWLGVAVDVEDPWPAVVAAARREPARPLIERGASLGLPVAVLADPAQPRSGGGPGHQCRVSSAPPVTTLEDLVVIDLGALWAGPLCGSLLAQAGAQVWKVESTRRPDGARRGPARFFDLLNAGKRSVAVDLTTVTGRRQLHALVAAADVVIEASRPRALEQLGLDALGLLEHGRPRVWISITAHGRRPPGRDRVGFGDDAAVAGGLVCWDPSGPCFCADAVADPATAVFAAAASLDALAVGGRWMIDIALADVGAHLAGPTLPVPEGLTPAPPTARPARGPGPGLGADTEPILSRLTSR